MAVALYMDVHIPAAITEQLRRRGVDVLTAIDDGTQLAEDDEILIRAHELQRLVVTQDARFRAMAEEWQRTARPFSGLLFGRQQGGSIGEYVETLELIAKASDPDEWTGRVEFIPY